MCRWISCHRLNQVEMLSSSKQLGILALCRSQTTKHLKNTLPSCRRLLSTVESDRQEADESPSFKAIAPEHPPRMLSEDVVPGKGPPPEAPVTCCMSGCANCVWIQYAEDLTNYYKDGGDKALKELDKIDNVGLRAFIKLELGL